MPNKRPMQRSEVERLIGWAAEEGWNPGRNDAALFWELDPEGFLAIEVDGELVGGGAIIRHNPSFGFMGLFLMRPQFRGRRLGTELWYARRDRLIQRLEPGSTIGLDAVDQMIPFYARGGFETFYRHRRFEWQPVAANEFTNANVVDLGSVEWGDIASFDGQCFPGDRSAFLQSWYRQSGAVSLAVMAHGKIQGFGIMRPSIVGCKIGPLFANDAEIASRLLCAFAANSGEGPIYFDVPDNNPRAIALCQQWGMKEVFGCVRMYLGPEPNIDHDKIFATTTLEVG